MKDFIHFCLTNWKNLDLKLCFTVIVNDKVKISAKGFTGVLPSCRCKVNFPRSDTLGAGFRR